MLTQLYRDAQAHFDLTAAADQKRLFHLADELLLQPPAAVKALAERADAPLEFKLAHKLVTSRRYLRAIQKPLRLGIVFAMWGEHNRLRPKSPQNPHGEDALRTKLAQLAWATEGTPVTWRLYPVDDGDPHGSGRLAQEIAATHPLQERVRVLHLAHALPATEGPLRRLASPAASRKGGAIIYGCMEALAEGMDAIIYTDADLSVHLGQLGLLLRPWQQEGLQIVLGNRKHPDSILVKKEGRWGVGIKLLRHMQRMVGQAIFSRGIRDTQAAFKLYSAAVLPDIIAEPSVYDFSFDTDWILAGLALSEPFTTVPFAFIDSAAESASITQGPMTTWATLLLGLLRAVSQRQMPHNEAMARVLAQEIRTHHDLEILIHHLPPQLADATDAQLGDPALMSPAAVQAWIRQRKQAEGML